MLFTVALAPERGDELIQVLLNFKRERAGKAAASQVPSIYKNS
jgi:hypothetical protein